ncbi:hypothetical protein H0H92_004428 [Tricholoma furcatifolium]|nr:hypothetical protein H0H92_004428 [Tricholoma furcatifolium]
MMFLSLLSPTVFVAILQFSLSTIPASGLHLSSCDGDCHNLKRTVYNPTFTNPGEGTTWKVGDVVQVTWDLQGIPAEYRQQTSQLILGYVDPGSSNEHLKLDQPLAKGFKIGDGHVAIKVPNVPPRGNYIVVPTPELSFEGAKRFVRQVRGLVAFAGGTGAINFN